MTDTVPVTGTGPRGGTPLAELLDRVVGTGAVVTGDVLLSLAGIDLIRLDLRLLLIAVQTDIDLSGGAG